MLTMNRAQEDSLKLFSRERIESIFNRYDTQQKGYLIRNEYTLAHLALVGQKPTQKLAADSIITKNDFILRMSSLVGLIPLEEEIRMLFRSFDTRDRGFITWEDFWQSCNRIAPHLPATAVFDAFQEVDTDRDGRVAFRDFDRLMRSADPTK